MCNRSNILVSSVQLSAAERENTDLAQKASDALAEEEILQARISELTAENATIQTEKCDLISKLEELTAQKTTAESISAELMQEKQTSDHQRGIITRIKKKFIFTVNSPCIIFRNRTDCYESPG